MQYATLVAVYDALSATPKRLEKTSILSQFLQSVPRDEMEHIIRLVQGKVFPNWDSRTLGFSVQLAIKALVRVSGAREEDVMARWKELGDLGKVAAQLVTKKKQATLFSEHLSTLKVYTNLRKLAALEGAGVVNTKVSLVAELLSNATPAEAVFIIRTTLEDLRIGLGEGTLRDALVWAFEGKRLGIAYDPEKNDINLEDRTSYDAAVESYQEAYDLSNDFARVALVAKSEGLSGLAKITLVAGVPVKVMLFQKAPTMKEGLETVQVPCAIEYKYDGFRMQIHKTGNVISIFTRRLENVTEQFPDVVAAVEKHVKGETFILDAEAVGIDVKTHKYIAFQNISQRIKRKYDIKELSEKFPVELNIFDVLYYEGENLVHEPFSRRRAALVQALPRAYPGVISLAEQAIVSTEEDAQAFYARSLAAGNEGVMLKNLASVYKPGSRVGFGMKVKPVLETLEVVIVGAEYGEGKRGEWLATFVIAVRDPDTDDVLEIGRVGTGFKEKEEEGVSFAAMTQMLLPLVTGEENRFVHVKPVVIIEVNYEEIQKSPTYSSGYALRFPRFVRLREDRAVEDISTIEDVERYYAQQRGRNS